MKKPGRFLTVGGLIKKLEQLDKNLPVVMHMDFPDYGYDPAISFLPEQSDFLLENGHSTYVGDLNFLKIQFEQDEP